MVKTSNVYVFLVINKGVTKMGTMYKLQPMMQQKLMEQPGVWLNAEEMQAQLGNSLSIKQISNALHNLSKKSDSCIQKQLRDGRCFYRATGVSNQQTLKLSAPSPKIISPNDIGKQDPVLNTALESISMIASEREFTRAALVRIRQDDQETIARLQQRVDEINKILKD